MGALSENFFKGTYSHDVLRIISELLDGADTKALIKINSNVNRFIDILLESTKVKGARWDDTILRLEWSYEADRIKAFTESQSCLAPHQQSVVIDAL